MTLGDRLWIQMENQSQNISIDYDDEQKTFWLNSGNRSHICENEDVVPYVLLNYCKKYHKWGEFENKN